MKTTTLGVTGGMGSGKSTACQMLHDLGARVFSADKTGKHILQHDPAARAEIIEAFGPESYDADGQLDRAYVAQHVFGNEASVARINAIVHPRVRAAFQSAGEEALRDGSLLLVYEAALIFETGGEKLLDHVAVVAAPMRERIRRVRARDGSDEASVRSRMQHQLPQRVLRRRADFVLENGGSEADLRSQVEALYRTLTTRA